mmetsp:Transcript_13494/g.42265  ORF Transcript_13494/g.42265 Transcript_13494/m.42265 type:complete len:216 (+) Transcript_13494:166-813(+)
MAVVENDGAASARERRRLDGDQPVARHAKRRAGERKVRRQRDQALEQFGSAFVAVPRTRAHELAKIARRRPAAGDAHELLGSQRLPRRKLVVDVGEQAARLVDGCDRRAQRRRVVRCAERDEARDAFLRTLRAQPLAHVRANRPAADGMANQCDARVGATLSVHSRERLVQRLKIEVQRRGWLEARLPEGRGEGRRRDAQPAQARERRDEHFVAS